MLDIFDTGGVDAAFVYTFARYDLANASATHEGFDLASAGLVKVLNEGRLVSATPTCRGSPRLRSPRSPNITARSIASRRLTPALPACWSAIQTWIPALWRG